MNIDRRYVWYYEMRKRIECINGSMKGSMKVEIELCESAEGSMFDSVL